MLLFNLKKIFYKWKRKLIIFLFPTYYKGLKKVDLIIFDDIYPHPVSGFRLEEFNEYLNTFKKIKILIDPVAYSVFNTKKERHKDHVNELVNKNNSFKRKLYTIGFFTNINAKLFYCIFLNNIYKNIQWIEKFKIPFVFTLYPGGGFEFNTEESNIKLRKVLNSKMFRKVIVTQEITEKYLIENNFCKSEDIKFIFGCVVPQSSISNKIELKEYFSNNKDTFDICFCGAKYMSSGKDKGYDLFIEAAHKIAQKFDFVKFHVIGGFSEKDIDISAIAEKIRFYGYQEFKNLQYIYKGIDVIISPNRPFLLGKGAFDGFPLGTVIEASLNGVVALLSDNLQQNNLFENRKEIIIIDTTSESIEQEIIYLIRNPDELLSISKKGQKRFTEIYSNNAQISPRIDVLTSFIKKS